jgi:hypothetical protein
MTGPQPQPTATESEAGRLAVRWDTAENNLGPNRHIYPGSVAIYRDVLDPGFHMENYLAGK